MAINTGYEILVDSSVAADTKANIVKRVITALESRTLSIAYATTYSGGANTTNQATITYGGASANFGIRVILDSNVVGTDTVPELLERLITALKSGTLTIAHAAAYAAGTRTYNLTITVT